MSKVSAKGFILLGILFVIISGIAFLAPIEKTAVFWIAYAFTVVAFAAQIGIWKIGFRKDEALKSKFLGFPLVHVGIGYLIAQIIAFFALCSIPDLPVWLAALICMVIAGISAACLISLDVGRIEIERIEEKVKQKVFYIKELQVDVELMANGETDVGVRTALAQLAEKIRYSDPMSSERLAELEGRISAKVAELKVTVDKKPLIEELRALLDERNKKCKILK